MSSDLHNDQGDVVGLLCFRGAKSGGLSCIASAAAVHNQVLAERPDLLAVLYEAFYCDARGEQPAGRTPYYVEPRFSVLGGRLFTQHGRTYIDSAQRFPEVNIIALGSKAVNLADKDALWTYLENLQWTFECDHIIHLAALYRAGDWPVHHPATQFHVNMAININILEGWRRFFPKAKMTSIVSYCLYPSTEHPHPESELWGHEPEDYLFAYAFTKKALLIGQRAYRQEHGLSSTSVV